MARRLLLAAAALALVVPAWALAQANQLSGEVGPGFEIRLQQGGAAVTHLDPGSYAIEVDDRSDLHNFHLSGPGVDMATSTPAIEKVNWQVTFVDGSYRFVCDVHPTQMRGEFTVGTPPPPPPPPPPPAVRRLAAFVGPGKSIRVSARATRAGRYVITVNDRSARDNFHLTGPGVNRKTGVAFRGRSSWRLTLRRGTYRFRSDATPALKGTLRVT
jgi:hypothetical protein